MAAVCRVILRTVLSTPNESFAEVYLARRCVNCGEVADIEEIPDRCPNCGRGREELSAYLEN